MKIGFFSNYLTHHQIPFCLEMKKRKDMEFYFVSTMPMEEERKQGGWTIEGEYDFEIKAYLSNEQKEKALLLAKECDVMIIGSAPEEYVKYRMKKAKTKLTLRYSERIYKNGRWRVLSPRGALNRVKTYFRYLGKPLYMLCASAYTAGDLAMLGSYLGKCFKWGYFPRAYQYNQQELLKGKKKNSILWVARLIDWKKPEIPVLVAKKLKEKGYDFCLNMIGDGVLKEEIEQLIKVNCLEEQVNLLGAMTPEQVRKYMEESSIFLFTSNQKEGWGAVLNEAMNSACAVVANSQIGSVPFLLENEKNGCVYYKNNVDKITDIIEKLLNDQELSERLGLNAHDTIVNKWSAAVAAERLIETCENLLNGKKKYFKDGPLSKAKIKVKKG